MLQCMIGDFMKDIDLKKLYLIISVNAFILSLFYTFYSIFYFKNNALIFTSSIILVITSLALLGFKNKKQKIRYIINIVSAIMTLILILFNILNNFGLININ
jgi:hypothetical protein